MRPHRFTIFILFLFWAFWTAPAGTQQAEPEAARSSETPSPGCRQEPDGLLTCYARSSGVTFLCHPDWHVRVVDEFSTIITICEEPFVTLAISRLDSPVRYLGQLSRSFFDEKQIYMDNFQKDDARFAGGEAVELKAFSKLEPDMRYLGYFFLNDGALNSVFFAVYPKERWDDYKFLIKKLAESFRRI